MRIPNDPWLIAAGAMAVMLPIALIRALLSGVTSVNGLLDAMMATVGPAILIGVIIVIGFRYNIDGVISWILKLPAEAHIAIGIIVLIILFLV